MTFNQVEVAPKLLQLIRKNFGTDKKTLTYKRASEDLGYKASYSRPMAHVCNLLDAAAALAGVPLLALVAVRDASEDINPEAFKREFGARREQIVARSRSHLFTDSDFDLIKKALFDLGSRGDQKAWAYIERVYPGDLLYLRLIGAECAQPYDAINDIGSDMATGGLETGFVYARDSRVRNAVLTRAAGKCEYCEQPGFLKPDGSRYLETHHVIALAKDGADRVTNVIAVCSNDHREAHFGVRAQELEADMIRKLKEICRINIA